MSQSNIAQLEFFLAGRNASGLSSLLRELHERVSVGSPIKVTVRLHDTKGVLTSLVQEAQTLENKKKTAEDYFYSSRGPIRIWFDKRISRLAGKSISLRDRATKIAVRELCAHPANYIELEVPKGKERLFRQLYGREHHELLESVKRAVGVWIFLYEPKNMSMVGNLM